MRFRFLTRKASGAILCLLLTGATASLWPLHIGSMRQGCWISPARIYPGHIRRAARFTGRA